MITEKELGPVAVQWCSDAQPVTFAHLAAALAAAREGLDLLPLSKTEHRWLDAMLAGEDAEAWAAKNLEQRGIWTVPYQVGAIINELIIRPVSEDAGGRERGQALPGDPVGPPGP
ncbi:hypothetical protein E6W39_28220 [Kitasatospora acidiphila]|uniref:Uncharacterized protein n=1 Tax=Kitasatospora acidiphila TaxID=2567942 RepID=A0A540W8T4_9ACTN|nr:hypothetical protein [Kitasatospora acidiphila]TQF05411.1 hypothetical protein E6W39_28220 [Kitasatospora acidiphila]